MESGHKFAHVSIAQLSWHVQNCGLIASLLFKKEQYELPRDLDNELINTLWNKSLEAEGQYLQTALGWDDDCGIGHWCG